MSGAVAAVRAAAGSGKTYALTTRYLDLLRRGVAPEAILASTFTRKAAGEILGRVLKRLAEASLDEAARADLERALGGTPLPAAECRALLARVARSLHRVSIGTLDAFFARLARSFRWEAGLPAAARVVDEKGAEAEALRRLALQHVFADARDQGREAELTTLLEAVQSGRPRRAVAGALEELAEQLHAIYRDVPDEACWNRIPACGGELGPAELARGLALLRDALPGLSAQVGKAAAKFAEQVEQGRWAEVFGGALGTSIELGDGTYSRKPLPEGLVGACRPLTAHARAVVVRQARERLAALYRLARLFSERYEALRRREGVLLYSDVPALVASLVAARPLDEIEYRLDGRIDHLLLDEFQDTNPCQWDILRPFALRIAGADDDAHTFFSVGDLKQAIYGWRGATPEIFARLGAELGDRLEWGELAKSWRSSPVVLGVVDRVFGRLQGLPSLAKYPSVTAAWARHYTPHEAARQLPGYVELVTAARGASPADDGTDDEGDDGLPPGNPLDWAAERVRELHGRAPWASIGVLLRRNDDVRQLLFRLGKLGVPASGEGGATIVDEPAVEAILAALTLADHPGSSIAAFHVAHTPLGAELHPAFTAGGVPGDDACREVSADVRARLSGEGYGAIVAEWARLLAPHCDRRGALRLAQLVQLAEAWDADAAGGLRPAEFVAHVAAAQAEEPSPAPVRVLSIHKSKGLEFDAVVLPGLDAAIDGKTPAFVVDRPDPCRAAVAVYPYVARDVRPFFPGVGEAIERAGARTADEALCLLYVAMTRARYALYMGVAPLGRKASGELKAGPLRPASVLRDALGPFAETDAGGETLFAAGDPAWFERVPVEATQAAAEAAPVVTGGIALAKTSISARRGVRWAAPSSLEKGGLVHVADLLGTSPPDARRYGSLIHAWFALVRWAGDPPPSDDALLAAGRRDLPGADDEWMREQLPAFRAMLGERVVIEALTPPAPPLEAEALIEHPFVASMQGLYLRGRFDRVVLHRLAGKIVGAELIDWKTDGVDATSEPAVTAGYAPQIEAYRAALCSMLGLSNEQVTARLVYVSAGLAATL